MEVGIRHKDCPKVDPDAVLWTDFPIFQDLTRPRDPAIKLDQEFKVLKCVLCGQEITVRWTTEFAVSKGA